MATKYPLNIYTNHDFPQHILHLVFYVSIFSNLVTNIFNNNADWRVLSKEAVHQGEEGRSLT